MKKPPGVFLDKILKSLTQCNTIQYVAYRTASKIQILQKTFQVENLPIDVFGGILQKHQLTSTENAVRLTPSELCDLMHDVFFVISQKHSLIEDVDHAVQELCRFLLLVLQKDGGVELLGVKVVMAVLCGSKPRDKYSYLFTQLADHNSVLTSKRMELLLQRLVLLTNFIGEGQAFGKALIPATVQSCFEGLSGGSLGISLETFIQWLSRDPQLLVWISTVHRLHLANLITHEVKCSVCKCAPIIGLRYRCLRCLTYNLCQECFFTGKVSRSHKRNHPVQEYCYQSTARQSLRALLVTLGNKLRKNGWKLQYLPAEQRQSYLAEATLQLDQLEESTRAMFASSDVSAKDIETIIAELEEHSRKLLQYVDHVDAPNVINFLHAHRSMMQTQVARLKSLKKQLELHTEKKTWMGNSTPFARGSRHASRPPPPPPAISPITSDSLALTWDKYDIDDPPCAMAEGPRVLTWDDNSETSNDCGRKGTYAVAPSPSKSAVKEIPGFTWLQSTVAEASRSNCDGIVRAKAETDGDVRKMQDDLDEILDRLQELLSNYDKPEENAKVECVPPLENILERI